MYIRHLMGPYAHTLSLHDALPIFLPQPEGPSIEKNSPEGILRLTPATISRRSEEHTSELQSHHDLVCRLLLEKKNEPSLRNAAACEEVFHLEGHRCHLQRSSDLLS